MKIQIWSDFACPFCYIGKRHLELALATFAEKDRVEVTFHSFQLNLTTPKQNDNLLYAPQWHDDSVDAPYAQEMTAHLLAQAANVGLVLQLDTLIPSNTFDAHRLLHYAADQGVAESVCEMLFHAQLCASANLADRRTLVALAQRAGLDGQTVKHLFNSRRYTDEVHCDEAFARQLHISSVPFFMIDNKYAITGAASVAVFSDVLNQALQEEQRLSALKRRRDVNHMENRAFIG